jgi:hypothetical protein
MMNYLQELNAFRDWTLLNKPTTSEIVLWYALMSINNMTGWKQQFTAANQTVQLMTGLSKATLDRARNKLTQKGLLKYLPGNTRQAGTYELVSISAIKRDQCETNNETNMRPMRDQCETNGETINKHKQKEIKQDNNSPPSSPFENYTENPELLQRLKEFLEMRKAIKKPMTDRAKSELLSKLDKLASTDEEKIAILDQSIFNSWQGVFALKQTLPFNQRPRNQYKDPNKCETTGEQYEIFVSPARLEALK